MNLGEKIVYDAWNAFDRWRRKHNPDGDLDPLEEVEAYSKWCDDKKRMADVALLLQHHSSEG